MTKSEQADALLAIRKAIDSVEAVFSLIQDNEEWLNSEEAMDNDAADGLITFPDNLRDWVRIFESEL